MRRPYFHYMIDCYFRDPTKPDGVRCESRQIKAMSDEEAISQAPLYTWKNPIWFKIRKETRKDSQVIYRSKDATQPRSS
jgi:hypothetical protein